MFHAVFQNASGLGVHPDLMDERSAPDIERIAQAAPAPFSFQLLGGDRARERLECNRAGFLQAELRLRAILLAVKGAHWRKTCRADRDRADHRCDECSSGCHMYTSLDVASRTLATNGG